jgi:dienelactone hydrolase
LAKQSGFTVYIPDIFPGGPIDPKDFTLPSKASDGPPGEDAMGKNFENFGNWMGKGNGPDKTYPIFKKVLEEVAKEGPVGAIGYCYGGKLAYLASNDSLVKGIALYHPSLLEPQEAENVKSPVLINGAELDPREWGRIAVPVSFSLY